MKEKRKKVTLLNSAVNARLDWSLTLFFIWKITQDLEKIYQKFWNPSSVRMVFYKPILCV